MHASGTMCVRVCVCVCACVQNVAGDFGEFARHHKRFVSYLETLTPYLQLRLVTAKK